MLVLSRKLHESLMIGQDIEVSIAYIDGDRVGLSIDGPENVRIDWDIEYDDKIGPTESNT